MSKQFPHPFGKLAGKYREMRRKLPAEVSIIATDEFKGNFRIGGYRGDNGVTFWRARKLSKKSKGRAILIKSGRLRRGIRPQPTYDSARVVNDVPYAKAHNEGFEGTVRVRGRMKKNGKRGRSFKRKMKLAARPIMITGKPLINNIDKHITTQLETLWQNAPDK